MTFSTVYASVPITAKSDGTSSDIGDFQNSSGSNLIWIDSNGNLLAKNNELRIQGSGGSNYAIFATPSLSGNVTLTLPSVTSTLSTLGANTFTGTQTLNGANIALGSNSITTTTFTTNEQSTVSFWGTPSLVFTPTSGSRIPLISLIPSGTVNSTAINFFRTSSQSEIGYIGSDLVTSGEFGINVLKSGSGSLRPWEFYMNSGGVAVMDTSRNFGVYGQRHLCLDASSGACGNNYIVESSANVNDFYAGGVKVASFQSTGLFTDVTFNWDTNGNTGGSSISLTNSPCTHTSVQWLPVKYNNGTTGYMPICH